ncbi:hypothetical protein WH47_06797, partial [Habropoda laboriosa]
ILFYFGTLTSSAVTTQSSIRLLAYLSKTGGVFLILRYIKGCVNIGSSISLWPFRLYDTISITTSLWKVALHSAATLQTCITATGSSELTWKIGAFTTLATSLNKNQSLF